MKIYSDIANLMMRPPFNLKVAVSVSPLEFTEKSPESRDP